MAVTTDNQYTRANYATANLGNTDGVDPLADNSTNLISAEDLRQAIYDLRNSAAFRKDDQYIRFASAAQVDQSSPNTVAITITDDYPASYSSLIPIRFVAEANSTGDVSVNVNGLGAVGLYKADNSRVSTDDIQSGKFFEIIYSTDADGGGTAGFNWFEGIGGAVVDTSTVTQITGTTATITDAGVYVFTGSSACAVSLTSKSALIGNKITFINMGTADCTFNDTAGTETLKLSDPYVIYAGTAQDIYYTGIASYEWCFV